tara:strand:- start:116 stop:667 length:552 start_codon:yes stop_codon:yes gene_type:complete
VGGVVIERDRGVVRVRELEVGNIGTVNLELELVIIVEDRESRAVRRGKVLDWVVEIELLDLGARRDRLLSLGDQHILGLGSEDFALLGIEVGVIRVDVPLLAGISGGGTPSDAKLHVVILEGNEWKSSLPILTESETERVEALVGRATVEITGNRLGRGGRGERGGDEGRVGGILLINKLPTN